MKYNKELVNNTIAKLEKEGFEVVCFGEEYIELEKGETLATVYSDGSVEYTLID